jgi:diguanylate cyclase (GGDEF)-like protein
VHRKFLDGVRGHGQRPPEGAGPLPTDGRLPPNPPSDRDETLSDRDQEASDADQAASDLDHQHRQGDASYEHSSAVPSEGTRRRLETGGLRDEAGIKRDAAAGERDDLAALRDADALAREVEADKLDVQDDLFDRHTLRVQELRSRSAMARRRAAEDRERARRDRDQAACDREDAARDREEAARERRQAGTDELTGARRRGVGLEELEREIDRARRTETRLIAVYVDVDHLKSVNDAEGHSAGDELLCRVVAGLKRHMRSYDLIVRLGGDEFLCVLPDVSLAEARRRFHDLNAALNGGSTGGSVSVGFGELRDDESPLALIDRADQDLLAARAK